MYFSFVRKTAHYNLTSSILLAAIWYKWALDSSTKTRTRTRTKANFCSLCACSNPWQWWRDNVVAINFVVPAELKTKKFEDFVVAKTECCVLVLVFVFVPEYKALYDRQRQPRPDLFPFPHFLRVYFSSYDYSWCFLYQDVRPHLDPLNFICHRFAYWSKECRSHWAVSSELASLC